LAPIISLGCQHDTSSLGGSHRKCLELRKNPKDTGAAGDGFPVAILTRNEPAFYGVPAKAYEALLDRLEDMELNEIADARCGVACNQGSMSFELGFLDEALGEWRKLDGNIREQFKKKLEERRANPRVPSAKLSRHSDRYKIKLRSTGYRPIYEVRDQQLLVVVIAIGKRERNAVYKAADKR